MNNLHLPGAPDAAGGTSAIRQETWNRRRCPHSVGVELHHPSIHSFGIELLIDRAIKRIGEVNPPPITADLDRCGPPFRVAALAFGWVARETFPPILTVPVSFGENGSDTWYSRKSPVPQQET